MIKKFKKFTKLSSEEKKLFLEAYVTLGIIRAAILTLSFKRLTRALEQCPEKKELPKLSEEEMRTVQIVGKSITRAAAYTPWKSACLVQSLCAQRMLKKRAISGVFYLGVMKDEESKAKMKAHAWSQCGDIIVTGAKGHESFTILSLFSWR
ncbi:MAG: lasso peptide biosynthesis B2 protein [Campylobacterota bacterium]|nr:lasso peptide biosynthesis B2 protein [Campylobacterota bacterium]